MKKHTAQQHLSHQIADGGRELNVPAPGRGLGTEQLGTAQAHGAAAQGEELGLEGT